MGQTCGGERSASIRAFDQPEPDQVALDDARDSFGRLTHARGDDPESERAGCFSEDAEVHPFVGAESRLVEFFKLECSDGMRRIDDRCADSPSRAAYGFEKPQSKPWCSEASLADRAKDGICDLPLSCVTFWRRIETRSEASYLRS